MAEKQTPASNPDRPPEFRNLVRLLSETQEKYGCLPVNVLDEISMSLGISRSNLYGVATFYSFLSIRAQGRHTIKICKSLPCFLKESQHIIKAVEDAAGIKSGTADPNQRFSIQLTNCIGECDRAPAMIIDGRVYVDLSPSKISRILKEYE